MRGGETLDMLQAMNTGHEGSMTTVHANSTLQALSRLTTLAAMSEIRIANESIHDQVNSAMEIIVQLHRRPNGSRGVSEIVAVPSFGAEAFSTVALWRPDRAPDPVGRLGERIVERLRAGGCDPSRLVARSA